MVDQEVSLISLGRIKVLNSNSPSHCAIAQVSHWCTFAPKTLGGSLLPVSYADHTPHNGKDFVFSSICR